jgi:inner membrane protein
MEPVTHFLTGACLGRSGFNRKTAYATLAMTLAAEAPDLDVLWGFRGPVTGFEHHRGITHTFVGAPFVALAVTGACWLFHRFRHKKPELAPRWWLVWFFSLLAALSHLLDFTNNYGLRPFYPFNPRWYSWDIVFIFEPIMFGALLLALVVPAILGLADREIGAKRTRFRGRGWAVAALVCVVVLYAYRNAEHEQAMNVVRNFDFGLGGTSPRVERVALQPYPINPYRWFAVMETPDYFRTAYVDLRTGDVTSDPHADIIYKPPVTQATLAAKQSYLGHIYLDWSRFPVVEDVGREQAPGKDLPAPPPGATTVEFRDLRFDYSALFLNRSRNAPLSAWAYIGPGNQVEGMFMSGSEQESR